jgi:uncharacterized surface protein with fasciclin (FAS1) repeats
MRNLVIGLVLGSVVVAGCGKKAEESGAPAATAPAVTEPSPPPSNVPPLGPTNIVSIAVGSKDHTTLVAALKAADYVTAVAASGPLTVFAPTNAAFDKLPKGTLDDLLKPENKAKLQDVLKYHVTTSVHAVAELKDGDVLSMADGKKATIHVQGDKVMINDATIVTSIKAENGIVHVIDGVLVPPAQ